VIGAGRPAGRSAWINPAFVTRWRCAQAPTVSGLLDVVDPGDHAVVEEAWKEIARALPRRATTSTHSPGCSTALVC